MQIPASGKPHLAATGNTVPGVDSALSRLG